MFVFEKSVRKAFLFYQAKPSFHLELIQKYKPQRISSRRKKVSGFIIDDEIQIKVGSELINLALDCYWDKKKEILALSIYKERNMFVVEHFISNLDTALDVFLSERPRK